MKLKYLIMWLITIKHFIIQITWDNYDSFDLQAD